MQAHMREELTKEKRNLPMKVVKRRVTMMTMMNRCQKQLQSFKLNINSVCTFSSNSKLEYFAGKLRALWELSGSSLGAHHSCGYLFPLQVFLIHYLYYLFLFDQNLWCTKTNLFFCVKVKSYK
jgi:hypothetical protein